jgi:hypothetical protein
LWDIDTCKVIKKWTGHTSGVGSVCWSRDGRRVLSGSYYGTVRQWEVESGETIENILASIETGLDGVFAVVYSPDTTLIATGEQDGPYSAGESIESSVKIWDAKTGKLVATLKGHTVHTLRVSVVPGLDAKTLISGSHDNHSITRLGFGIQPTGSKPPFWMITPAMSLPLQYHRMAASSQALRMTRQRGCGTSTMDNLLVRPSSTQSQCYVCRFRRVESD